MDEGNSGRLITALGKYRKANRMTQAELNRKLNVTKMAWWYWTKGGRSIPKHRVNQIIYDLKLNRKEITGEEIMPKEVYFVGSVDYAKRYAAAAALGNTEDARRYLREAGYHIYDLINSYDLPVDYVLTNRSAGETVQIITHIGLVKYMMELRPSKILSYRFTLLSGGSSGILHDGAFSMAILKVITSFLNKENKKKTKRDQKHEEDANNLLRGARDLTSIEL